MSSVPLCAFIFQQQPESPVSNRMRNMKGAFVCVKCAGVRVCAFVCVLLYSKCATLCRWTEDVTDKRGHASGALRT